MTRSHTETDYEEKISTEASIITERVTIPTGNASAVVTIPPESTTTEEDTCVDLDVTGIGCKNYVETHGPRICYEVERTCCKSCRELRDNSDPGEIL